MFTELGQRASDILNENILFIYFFAVHVPDGFYTVNEGRQLKPATTQSASSQFRSNVWCNWIFPWKVIARSSKRQWEREKYNSIQNGIDWWANESEANNWMCCLVRCFEFHSFGSGKQSNWVNAARTWTKRAGRRDDTKWRQTKRFRWKRRNSDSIPIPSSIRRVCVFACVRVWWVNCFDSLSGPIPLCNYSVYLDSPKSSRLPVQNIAQVRSGASRFDRDHSFRAQCWPAQVCMESFWSGTENTNGEKLGK